MEGTRLTGFIEAFHSSLAQSAGELWLKVLGKILAPKFGRLVSQWDKNPGIVYTVVEQN